MESNYIAEIYTLQGYICLKSQFCTQNDLGKVIVLWKFVLSLQQTPQNQFICHILTFQFLVVEVQFEYSSFWAKL